MRKDLKDTYTNLVNFLGVTLGPDFEVVLVDVKTGNGSIIAIANSNVSGRKVGGPITNMAMKFIMSHEYDNQGFFANYRGQLSNGKRLRSSTLFIRDHGELVGFLCVNFDDSRYEQSISDLLHIIHPAQFAEEYILNGGSGNNAEGGMQIGTEENEVVETFPTDAGEYMQQLVREATTDYPVPAERLTADERISIISRLYSNGYFEMRGSVQFLTDQLGCSQATIYRYINEVKKTYKNSN